MTAIDIINNEPVRKDDGNRSVDFTWELQDLSDNVQEVLVLSASHDSDRKCFYATLRQQSIEQGPTSTRISFAVFGGVTVCREPVARFSQKRLDEFAAGALATLREIHDEKIDALLVPSDRSCGCTGMHHRSGCEVYAAEARALNAGRR